MQISDVEVYDVTLTGIWTVPDVWYHVWYRIIIRFGNSGNWAAFVYVGLKGVGWLKWGTHNVVNYKETVCLNSRIYSSLSFLN